MRKFNPFTPPRTVLPILQKLIDAYKIWHEYLLNFNKIIRFNLGSKIDSLFLEIIECLFTASHKSKESNKLLYLNKASEKLDLLKFVLQVTWEIKVLDNKKYIALSEKINEIGRILGGWLKQTKTP